MMVSPDFNTVIITPMKCGSTTIQELLIPRGWIYVMGPHPWDADDIEKHTHVLPWRCRHQNAKRLLMVRDPLQRAVSLYRHRCLYWRPISIEQWLARHLMEPINAPIADLYPRADALIHLEHMQADLAQHGINVSHVPVANKTPGVVQFSEFHRELVRVRYLADFRLGGYQFASPV